MSKMFFPNISCYRSVLAPKSGILKKLITLDIRQIVYLATEENRYSYLLVPCKVIAIVSWRFLLDIEYQVFNCIDKIVQNAIK